jgi:formamidopyrimidine-DNA glycosylase
MPELPDLEVYLDCLRPRILGKPLRRIRLRNPFLLRSVDPPLAELHDHVIVGLRRLGKRLVWQFDHDLLLVLHLMIAGRIRWKAAGFEPPKRQGLAAFDFDEGTLSLTEAGSKKRASLYVIRGEEGLEPHRRDGLEVLEIDRDTFAAQLTKENHSLKRSLTDPRCFSGIGNAYSDEILHRARLSPVRWTRRLLDEEITRLHSAVRDVLRAWTERLRAQVGDGFPDKVTAFRPQMAVHGKYGKPCPVCRAPVQRIVYASNECNYCAICQTNGKVLADRALSPLLRQDWPRSIEEWEERYPERGG